jgi:hypothetical protein
LALEATSRRDPNKLVLATNGHFDAYGKAFDAASGAARDWFQQDLSPVTVATTAQQRQAISSKGRRDDHGHCGTAIRGSRAGRAPYPIPSQRWPCPTAP